MNSEISSRSRSLLVIQNRAGYPETGKASPSQKVFTLIIFRDCEVFAPEPLGRRDVLLGGTRIVAVAEVNGPPMVGVALTMPIIVPLADPVGVSRQTVPENKRNLICLNTSSDHP